MEKSTIQLPDTWLEHLKDEFNQDSEDEELLDIPTFLRRQAN